MRRLLFCILALFLTVQSSAQIGNPLYNSYLSGGLGASAYFKSGGVAVGAGAGGAFGKWILNTAAVRARIDAHYIMDGGTSDVYAYANLEYIFDPVASIRGRNLSRYWRTYMFVGVGLVHNFSGDNDFCGSFGLGADRTISQNMRLYFEARALVHPSDFDNNVRSSIVTSLSTGLMFDIQNNPTRSRNGFETQCLENDWFFQIALGVSSFNYKGISSMNERLSLLTPIFEFGMGKRLNTTWLIRVNASGLYTRSSEELFSYYNVRGDLMLDVRGLFNPDTRGLRRFIICPYVSTGVVSRLDDQSKFLFSTTAGLFSSYKVNNRNSLFIDARYLLTPPRFSHTQYPQSKFSVGLATLTVGYSYMFTKSSF